MARRGKRATKVGTNIPAKLRAAKHKSGRQAAAIAKKRASAPVQGRKMSFDTSGHLRSYPGATTHRQLDTLLKMLHNEKIEKAIKSVLSKKGVPIEVYREIEKYL